MKPDLETTIQDVKRCLTLTTATLKALDWKCPPLQEVHRHLIQIELRLLRKRREANE